MLRDVQVRVLFRAPEDVFFNKKETIVSIGKGVQRTSDFPNESVTRSPLLQCAGGEIGIHATLRG